MPSSSLRLRQLSLSGTGSAVARLAERANLTPSGVVVFALVVVGWLSARWLGAKAMYLMVYASLLAILMAWFVSRRRLAVDVERSELPTRMREDQSVSVNLVVTARRRLATVVLQEALPEGMGQTVHIPVSSLRAGEDLEHRYALTPRRRGVYQVGPVTATWSDPFGLTTQKQRLAEPVEVIVHPTTEVVRDRVLTRMWEDPPVRPPVSKPWPVGFEFYGMRDYVPGDDLRLVVWSAVAKTGKMMVRESEQGITDRVVIVVDTDREQHSQGEVSDTFETAVRVAASAGVQHLEDGFSVTLASCGGRLLTALRGARAHLELLDALAVLKLDDLRLSALGPTLIEESRTRPHVLLITPRVDSDLAKQLKLVVDRGVSVAVAHITWDETDPASAGRALSLGCQVVQVPVGAPLAAVFANQVGGGRQR